MRTVVLVGTDHKFQKPLDGPHRAGIEGFRNTIRKLCDQHKLRAVAEEMSLAALRENNLQESVAQQLCIELGGLPYNFSDPAPGGERRALGIRDNGDMRNECTENDWSQEQLDAEVLKNTEVSHRIREREWLRRIQMFDKWPLLFICGANHFSHFAQLIQKNGIKIIEAYQDWEPAIEVILPTPLYKDDRLHCANHLTCLSKLKRITTRQLLPDEKVTVKQTACGKDFWAFEIETADGSEGWVLNEDGGIKITFPNS